MNHTLEVLDDAIIAYANKLVRRAERRFYTQKVAIEELFETLSCLILSVSTVILVKCCQLLVLDYFIYKKIEHVDVFTLTLTGVSFILFVTWYIRKTHRAIFFKQKNNLEHMEVKETRKSTRISGLKYSLFFFPILIPLWITVSKTIFLSQEWFWIQLFFGMGFLHSLFCLINEYFLCTDFVQPEELVELEAEEA